MYGGVRGSPHQDLLVGQSPFLYIAKGVVGKINTEITAASFMVKPMPRESIAIKVVGQFFLILFACSLSNIIIGNYNKCID
jgi:hypothetical protein